MVPSLYLADAAEQETEAAPYGVALPARRFFDPLAAAVIEQRRDLLWSRDNATRVSQLLRAISHRPDEVFRSETAYLRLRVTLRRLETFTEFGLKPEQRDEIAQSLWDLAIMIEEGTLTDALERLREAQERLALPAGDRVQRAAASGEPVRRPGEPHPLDDLEGLRVELEDLEVGVAEQPAGLSEGEVVVPTVEALRCARLQCQVRQVPPLAGHHIDAHLEDSYLRY